MGLAHKQLLLLFFDRRCAFSSQAIPLLTVRKQAAEFEAVPCPPHPVTEHLGRLRPAHHCSWGTKERTVSCEPHRTAKHSSRLVAVQHVQATQLVH